jgi:D-galactarolactone cycloisomerase
MKITGVKTFLLHHVLERPSGPATYWYRTRQTLFIKVESDAGLCGWGETAAFTGVRSFIEEQYAPILVGRDPLERRRLWRELWGPNFGNGLALGGVDIALDDLRGKALGLSVGDLYGGRLRDRVPAYWSSTGYVEGVDPAESFPREAADVKARGFRAMKLRIGGQTIRRDVAAVAAVREVLGPEVKLMADGNGSYTLGAAIEMGRELERLGLHWFEEPLPQSVPDYTAYEVLTDKLDIPIAACEGLTSRGMFKEAITRRAMDIVQPDVSLAGGIGECLFVAELARLWGIHCTPHVWAGGLVTAATTHLVSLLPDASWSRAAETPMLELGVGDNPFLDQLFVEPLEVRDGFVSVPRGPGLGVEVDEEKLKFHTRP